MIDIAGRVFGTPLLLAPEKVQAICFALQDKLNLTIEAPDEEVMRPAASVGRWEHIDRSSGIGIEGGVGVISITGTLVNRGAWIGTSSGLQSYDGIAQQLRMAKDNNKIKSVLLDLNTYGGEVGGIASLASEIRELSQAKRVVALSADAALSAGYWLAAAASEVVVTETGVVGSIGVVMTHQDVSEMAGKVGIKITQIYAGSEKILGSPYQALSDEDKEKLQAEVDRIYTLFSDRIDAYRSGRVNARATEARVYRGQAAVDAGLADRVMNGRDLLAEMQSATKRTRTMSDSEITRAEADAMVSKAKAEQAEALATAHQAATADAVQKAVTAERDRIAAIQAIARPGFDAEMKSAIDSGASAADFALSMLKAANERGVTIDAMRANSPPVVPHAAAPDETEGKYGKGKSWDAVAPTANKM